MIDNGTQNNGVINNGMLNYGTQIYGTLSYVSLYMIVILIFFILAEITAYFWHRFLAHKSWISLNLTPDAIRESHRFHHISSLEHDASEDFIWIIFFLAGIILILGLVYMTGCLDWLNKGVLVAILITTALVFILNWYIHLIVHTPEHWLHNTSYIQDMKTIHFVHHDNPRANYSIMNFTDTLFGTFSSGFPYTTDQVKNIGVTSK